jgi:hypothetical protein
MHFTWKPHKNIFERLNVGLHTNTLILFHCIRRKIWQYICGLEEKTLHLGWVLEETGNSKIKIQVARVALAMCTSNMSCKC